jgi:surface antigen
MTTGRLQSLFLGAIALTVLFAGPASAQLSAQHFRGQPKLTKSDLAIVRHLVRVELAGKPYGTQLSWDNPESTNSGTVRLLDRFASRGRNCSRVEYVIKPGPKQPSATTTNTYVLNNCQLQSGAWQIDSQAKPDKS